MSKLEKIDSNKVQLEIEVPETEVEQALARVYRKVVKKINLPGFRKGKAPRQILEARFGPEIFYEDALEILIPPAYEKAIKEQGLEPIDEPEMELVQMEKGKPLLFKAKVEIKPEVQLGNYKGIEIEQQKEEVTPEKVESVLQRIREQHARLVPVEDRDEVQEGDLVLIDFTGYIDGKPFEGGQAEGYSLEIGSGSFVPGFEEQLVGAKLNEEKRIEVIYPEKYYKEELAGKEAVFDVKVKEIKKKELPELDDSFVKEVSEFETIEEYRHDIEKKLKEELESRKKAELEIKLIDKISDGSEVEIPEVLVERQLERMLIDMDQYLRLQGLDLEKYLKMSGREISDIKAEQRAEAEKRVKRDLVLEAIMKKEGIEVEVDEQEIEEKIKEIAEHYNGGVEKVREFLIKQGRLEKLREEVRYRKTIDFLVSEATVKEIPAEEESA